MPATNTRIEDRDLYAELGVATDASSAAIRRRWRVLAKRHHPDAGGDPSTFMRLHEAYEHLYDSERRRCYDRDRRVTERPVAATPRTAWPAGTSSSTPVPGRCRDGAAATVRRRGPEPALERCWPTRSSLMAGLLGALLAGGWHAVELLRRILALRGTVPTEIDVTGLWAEYARIVAVETLAALLLAAAAAEHLRRWRDHALPLGAIAAVGGAVAVAAAVVFNPAMTAIGAVYLMRRSRPVRPDLHERSTHPVVVVGA